jgi:hypothetical protein
MNRMALGSVLAAALVGLCGCSSKEKPKDPTLNSLAIICHAYTVHCYDKHRPPREAADLTGFVRELYPDTDLDQLFVSPRDGQPFAIFYGCPVNNDGLNTVLAHEQVGANGTRYVLTQAGFVKEFKDDEFAAATFAQPRKARNKKAKENRPGNTTGPQN